jgi:hypothetical protein
MYVNLSLLLDMFLYDIIFNNDKMLRLGQCVTI